MTRRAIWLLGSITALGAVLRFASPGRIGLWRDEVQALNIASLPTLADITRFLYAHESHPPLFYYLEHVGARLAASDTGFIAAITLLASIALIPAVWWLASLGGGRWAGAVAAALVAVSVPLSFFGVQLRPYSLLSLATILGSAAMLRDHVAPSARWRGLWAVMALVLIYLHHVGVVIVTVQVGTAFLLVGPAIGWRRQMRAWAPFVGAVALGALPDLTFLAHQGRTAAYPVQHPVALWRPILDLWRLVISFPGELGIGALGALVCLIPRGRSAGPQSAEGVAVGQACYVATLFVVTVGLLVLASYRSNLLVPYVVLAIAPLGLTAAGMAIAEAVVHRWRWRAVLLAEAAITCVVLSTLAFRDSGKTDTDLVAHYLAAEARPSDLVILVPGALGPSFNRYFRGAQEQIDFPVRGPVLRYEFEDDFERVASPAALQMALNAIARTCEAGRRMWLITPAHWMVSGDPPSALSRRQFGGLGQADAARANLIERRAASIFGSPRQVVRPDVQAGAIESLEARLYTPSAKPHGETRCVVD